MTNAVFPANENCSIFCSLYWANLAIRRGSDSHCNPCAYCKDSRSSNESFRLLVEPSSQTQSLVLKQPIFSRQCCRTGRSFKGLLSKVFFQSHSFKAALTCRDRKSRSDKSVVQIPALTQIATRLAALPGVQKSSEPPASARLKPE